jgi:uncharacterized cupredoxin-like copper-binding protein
MKALVAIAVLALSLTAAAGCGSSSKKSSTSTTSSTTGTTSTPSATKPSGGGSTLSTDADPSGALKFTKIKLSAKSGTVTLKMKNPSPVQHGIGVKGNGVQQAGNPVGQGGVSTVTANLKPGKYEFYCPVDGHRQAGMEGTLTVQ